MSYNFISISHATSIWTSLILLQHFIVKPRYFNQFSQIYFWDLVELPHRPSRPYIFTSIFMFILDLIRLGKD